MQCDAKKKGEEVLGVSNQSEREEGKGKGGEHASNLTLAGVTIPMDVSIANFYYQRHKVQIGVTAQALCFFFFSWNKRNNH